MASSSGGVSRSDRTRLSKLPGEEGLEGCNLAFSRERAGARRDLIQADPEREHVTAAVQLGPAGLFRRHIGGLALDLTGGCGFVATTQCLGNAKVGDFHGATDTHQDVLRRDVSVDHIQQFAVLVLLLVRCMQACCGVRDDACRHSEVQGVGTASLPASPCGLEDPSQAFAIDPLHGDVQNAVVFA